MKNTNSSGWYVAVAATLAAFFALVAEAPAGAHRNTDVIAVAYTGEDYTGLSWVIDRADGYDLKRGFDLPNNSICSVRVRPGYAVTLFEGGNFAGEKLFLTGDAPALPGFWRRQASSLRVEPYPRYVEDWLESTRRVRRFTGTVTSALDPAQRRAISSRYERRIKPLESLTAREWYGRMNDAERVKTAADLLGFFAALGFDTREWTPNTLAQHINNHYDWRKESNILEVACIVVGISLD